MLDNLFGEGNYYDYPSFEVALYSLLLSFVLSTVIAFTYKYTYEGNVFPRHFFQAIVLSSMVTCMVIMAVGNNLAAGFGIIGAVAIIRFRTLVRDPRNIIFIFVSLSIGIANGVYGYAIAVAGTLLFSLIALLLYMSPFGKAGKAYFDLTFTVASQSESQPLIQFLKENKITYQRLNFRKLDLDKGYRYVLRLCFKAQDVNDDFLNKLLDFSDFREARIVASDPVEL